MRCDRVEIKVEKKSTLNLPVPNGSEGSGLEFKNENIILIHEMNASIVIGTGKAGRRSIPGYLSRFCRSPIARLKPLL